MKTRPISGRGDDGFDTGGQASGGGMGRPYAHPVMRIVSVTPSPVERESRTLRTAVSLARMGHESIVVEAKPSGAAARGLGFELISLGADPARAADAAPAAGADAAPGWRRIANRAVRVPATIAGFVAANRALADRLPAADVYYLHGWEQAPAVWIACRRHGARYVYDAHDFYPELIEGGEPNRFEASLMRRFYLAVEKRAGRKAAAVVTASAGFADLYAARDQRRPEVIVNFPDISANGGSPPDTIRAALGLPRDAFLVVMTGNAKVMTCLDGALAAMHQLPGDVHLAFVGSGYDEAQAGERIHFLPPLPASQLPGFLADADAAAVLYVAAEPFFRAALPNGAFNSIAAGLPLVYSRELAELDRIAREHELGVAVDPRDAESVASGIQAVRADLEAMRARVADAKAELSWAHEEPKLARLVAGLGAR
jgi:hypothetical protein